MCIIKRLKINSRCAVCESFNDPVTGKLTAAVKYESTLIKHSVMHVKIHTSQQ